MSQLRTTACQLIPWNGQELALEMSCGHKTGRRTRRRWNVPTDTEGLGATERKGACGQPSLSRLGPSVRRGGEVDEDVLKTISSFLTTFQDPDSNSTLAQQVSIASSFQTPCL